MLHALHSRFHAVLHRRHGAARFDRRASEAYDRTSARFLRGLYRRVASDVAAVAPAGGSVLDVGTGTGRLLLELAERRTDLTLVGVDLSPDMVSIGERHVRALHLADRVSLHVGDVAALPYPDARFDVVVSTLSMHHWPAVAAAGVELTRVLRPGGHLWIYDFRFVSMAEAASVVGGQRELVRPPWHPIALYARLAASG